MTVDNATGCPSSYEDLYNNYFDMMKSIVARSGIKANMVEDVAMDILTKFMERDALSWYDPQKLFDVGARPKFQGPSKRPARFASFLRQFVSLYVRQHLDTQAVNDRKRASVNPQSEESTETMIEIRANVSSDPTVGVEIMSTISAVIAEPYAREGDAENTWEMRRQSEVVYQRSRQALKAAILLADAGERVSGASVARILGWPTSVGVQSLKLVREELRIKLYGDGSTYKTA